MNNKSYLPAISGTLLVFSFLISSCTATKKGAVACPDYSKSRYYKVAGDHKKNYHMVSANQNGGTKNKMFASLSGKHKGQNNPSPNRRSDNENIRVTDTESISYFDKGEYTETLTASAENVIRPLIMNKFAPEPINDLVKPQTIGCDTIVLKSGAHIIGKVGLLAIAGAIIALSMM